MKHLCVQCKDTFKTSEELEVHMSNHRLKKQFSCTQCEQSFSQSGPLNKHKITHTGGRDMTVCIVLSPSQICMGSGDTKLLILERKDMNVLGVESHLHIIVH